MMLRLFRRNGQSQQDLTDEVDLAESKQKVYRLAKEMEALADTLQAKANELKRELESGPQYR
jgi:hypothetical protein